MRQFILYYWWSLLRYTLVSKLKVEAQAAPPKGVSLAESLKKRAAAMVRDSDNMVCLKKLRESELFSLNERKDSMFVCFYIQ